MLFQVVRTDNYARETRAERVVEENLSFVEADALCRAHQDDLRRCEEDWFEVRRQGAHIWQGMAEFV